MLPLVTRSIAPTRGNRWLIPIWLALGTAALYLPRLQDAPIYPLRDEMYFALTAHSVAFTGRDPSGLWWPVYFPIGPLEQPLMWFQSTLMYAIALVLRMLPLTEGAIRLPMVAAAIADVVLVYLVGKQLSKRELPAIAGAICMAAAPAHFVFGRTALDYQLPVPFILSWLYWLLRYERERQPRQLLAAGFSLGLGLYTLIAAYILVPIYALLTCLALRMRREPLARYAWLVAGVIVPATVGVLFVATHPAMVRDVLHRYEPQPAQAVGTAGAVEAFVAARRFSEAASVYLSFLDPRLLFVNGRNMLTGVGGIFLLPVAGAMLLGVIRALWPVTTTSVLLLGGLLTAAIPASLVNEPEAVRRVLELLPFVILLSVYGLDHLWSAVRIRAGRLAFVAMWAVTIYVAAAYRSELPLAQAFIRAATVPLAFAGLATLLRAISVDWPPSRRVLMIAVPAIALTQLAFYFMAGAVMSATIAVMVAIGAATILRGTRFTSRRTSGSPAALALLAVVACEFVYAYVDFSVFQRVGTIPAGAQIVAMRCLGSGLALVAALGMARAGARLVRDWPRGRLAAAAIAALVGIQFAYFYIDFFRDGWARYLQTAAVFAALSALAMIVRGMATARIRLGQFAIAALLGLSAIQFTAFYRDYFDGYQRRRASEQEGKVSLAYEAVLRPRSEPITAVYLAFPMESAFLRDLYWRFYLLKHQRPELQALTVHAGPSGLEPDAVIGLPPGALVVAGVSPEAQRVVDQLVLSGTVRRDVLVKAADDVPVFWILQRTLAHAR